MNNNKLYKGKNDINSNMHPGNLQGLPDESFFVIITNKILNSNN